MNHFEYFSEIEERFSRRRGSILLLSTLDWALIETWREAQIPLEAVLRGIDAAFDKHDARALRAKSRLRKVNGLAWCAQAVMEAAEEMVEAASGLPATRQREDVETGFESERVASFLERNAQEIEDAIRSPASDGVESGPGAWKAAAKQTAYRLRELSVAMRGASPLALDELDRTLTVLEEKLIDAVRAAAPEAELVMVREQADRELGPYRAKMSAVQLRQVQTQFLQKRLLKARRLPRLSLFYMGHDE